MGVEYAAVYKNSRWDAEVVRTIASDEELVVQGIVYATRTRGDRQQQPYAYISSDPDSGEGIWLNDSKYQIIEPE